MSAAAHPLSRADAHAIHLLDDLGRVVIPVSIRRQLGWDGGTALMIRREGTQVIVERWRGTCLFCGGDAEAQGDVLGQTVCASCRAALRRVLAAESGEGSA
jgi:transcriptional pleiotropic regulator of transition state genes